MLKQRFWTEIYAGAKLFYLSGLVDDGYQRQEVHNLARFISVRSQACDIRNHHHHHHHHHHHDHHHHHHHHRQQQQQQQQQNRPAASPRCLVSNARVPTLCFHLLSGGARPGSVQVMKFRPLIWRNTHSYMLGTYHDKRSLAERTPFTGQGALTDTGR
jgi:G3E family GTPase